MEDVGADSSLLLVGGDPTHQHPLLAYQIRQAVRQHGARLYVINHAETKLQRQAGSYIRASDEAEAIHQLATGDATGELADLSEKLGKESDAIVIFGDEIRGGAVEELVRWGLSLSRRTRFIALGDYANSRGAADMGVLPDTLPGYAPVSSHQARARYESVWGTSLPDRPGRNIRKILAGIQSGEIKALAIFGSNPIKTFGLEASRLEKLEFLFVAEMFPTETAARADVVVPATSFAEKAGTVTNTCGEVQSLAKTMRKAGTRSDLEILLALAELMGARWPYRSPEDVLREIVAYVPGYAVPLPSLLVGKAVPTRMEGNPPRLESPDLVFSTRDSMFTSGTLSRFSWALNSVNEAKRPYGTIF
jgi:NADH-quinone oxidoreductase subunit G